MNDTFGYGYHISDLWQQMEHEIFLLPSEPLPTDIFHLLVPITKSSKRGKVEDILKQLYLLAEQIIPNQEKKIFKDYLSNIYDYSGKLIYQKYLLEIPSNQIQEIYPKYFLEIPSDHIQEIYPKDMLEIPF